MQEDVDARVSEVHFRHPRVVEGRRSEDSAPHRGALRENGVAQDAAPAERQRAADDSAPISIDSDEGDICPSPIPSPIPLRP